MTWPVFKLCLGVVLALDLTQIAIVTTPDVLRKFGVEGLLPGGWPTGLPEWPVHLKWLLGAVLMLAVGRSPGQALTGALGVVLVMVLLDDTFEGHERLGAQLSARLGWTGLFGLRPQDIGELSVFAAMGMAALAMLTRGLRRAGAADRRDAVRLVLALAALAVVAIGMDMLAVALIESSASGTPRRTLGNLAALADDATEMAMASLALAFGVAKAAQARRAPT